MESVGIGAGLAAIGFWLFVAVAVVSGVWDGIKKREVTHETLRRLIESGNADEAVVDKILGSEKRIDRDLKVGGLITLSAAPGLAILGYFLSLLEAKALMPLLGVAFLTGCVGIGLLVAAKFAEREYREEAAGQSSRRV